MMKYSFYTVLLVLLFSFTACEEKLGDSILKNSEVPLSELDIWIDETFRVPYNINVQYKWNEADLDHSKVVVPPRAELVQPFLKVARKMWILPYIQVADEKEVFFQNSTCRELKLVGSGSWNLGSVTLGLAEGGYKISLYTVNDFDLEQGISRSDLREYFRVMHHEFGHILNQRKRYDPDFKNISGGYAGDWTSYSNQVARERGFISNYSMSGHGEDFVEILSYYICYSETEWNSLLATISNQNSVNLINRKVLSVSSYMQESYGVNIDRLRAAILEQLEEVLNGNLD